MNRRNFLIGAAALAGAAGLGAVFWQAGNKPSYPHVTLDSSTLAAYPDSPASVREVLAREEFRGRPVIVEFVAGWCPHCASFKPEMDKALTAQGDVARLTVVVQEGDHRTGQRGALAYIDTFRALAAEPYFPQVHLWQDGESRGYFVGSMPAEDISRFIEQTRLPAQTAFAPGPKPA